MVVGPVLSYVRWSFVVILGCHVALRTYELVTANQQLRTYATQAEDLAAANERNRLAREMHDGLGHYFTAIDVHLTAARTDLECDQASAIESLDTAHALATEGLAEVRRSVATLRTPGAPRPLEALVTPLIHASQALGLPTHLHVRGDARPLAAPVATALYRAVQEGLTNVRKHAHASQADVTLDYGDAACVRLSVQDDGVGAPATADAPEQSFGLTGLRERANELGGTLSIRTAPGQGFTLEMEVPT
jgi:signal transduction histidine kinase